MCPLLQGAHKLVLCCLLWLINCDTSLLKLVAMHLLKGDNKKLKLGISFLSFQQTKISFVACMCQCYKSYAGVFTRTDRAMGRPMDAKNRIYQALWAGIDFPT